MCYWRFLFWLFVKLQEHFLKWCFFSLHPYHLVATESLDQWVHTTTHIQMVGAIVLRDINHTRDAGQFFVCHCIAKFYRYSLTCLLPQRFHLFNGHEFTLANDCHAVTDLLYVAHDM